ncbi:hypothetical protein KPL74_01905 [Bacillus sp. NP157]|nr:hypothetical protein KPL74_01905 [Bacillus sp. NP157]
MTSIFSNIKSPSERRQLLEFWAARYAEAQPIMTPKEEALKDTFPRCGDYGFQLPHASETPSEKEAIRVRHDNLRFESEQKARPQDAERARLTLDAEKAARQFFEARDAASETTFAGSFGKLLEYDRAQGHPIADPTRDLGAHPATPAEQAAWMLRDGRELTHEDQAHQQQTDIHFARSRQEHLSFLKLTMEGEWFRPGPQAAMPATFPDPRPAIATDGVKMTTANALDRPLDIAAGLGERLQKRRALGTGGGA